MKLISGPATRNAEPIANVLFRHLPAQGKTLEIASGSGQHAAHFCAAMPKLNWQASDCDEDALHSINAWRKECGLENFLPPLVLDVCAETWPIEQADAVFCANMIHISPWESTSGLFRGAARILAPDAPLVLYGPFIEDSVSTSDGNRSFEQWLKNRDPSFGIRKLEEVSHVAEVAGFFLQHRVEMPANNLCLVYRRQ